MCVEKGGGESEEGDRVMAEVQALGKCYVRCRLRNAVTPIKAWSLKGQQLFLPSNHAPPISRMYLHTLLPPSFSLSLSANRPTPLLKKVGVGGYKIIYTNDTGGYFPRLSMWMGRMKGIYTFPPSDLVRE